MKLSSLLWYLLAIAATVATASLLLGSPLTSPSRRALLFGGLLVVGYLGATVLMLLEPRSQWVSLLGIGRSLLAGFAITFGGVLILAVDVPRSALVVGVASAGLLAVLPFLRQRPWGRSLTGAALLGVGGLWFMGAGGVSMSFASGPAGADIITNRYALAAESFTEIVPRTESFYAGGALASVEGGQLVATGDGALHFVSWSGAQRPEIQPLSTSVPLDRTPFMEAAGNGPVSSWFRVQDIDVIADPSGGQHLFASYHHWNVDEGCVVLRVSRAPLEPGALSSGGGVGDWETVYDTKPCFDLQMEFPGWPFRGMEGGGRMALLEEGTLLLTVGDHGFNGLDFVDDLVGVADADYGKTLAIDLASGSATVFTIGHRNPRGLFVDEAKRVWLTEHGPEGGDELNVLEAGANYGWPYVTYGTDYGSTVWPLAESQGVHDGYVEPVYAWVPSVAPGAIGRISGAAFPAWEGDLMMASLAGQTLYRIRQTGGRVSFVEPIPVGVRVRDFVERDDGALLLWTDSYSLVVLRPEVSPFRTCSTCHAADPTSTRLLAGPNLAGIVGRDVAALPGYEYSAALRQVGGSWTVERLHELLEDPQQFAPGSNMASFQGIEDRAQRQAIVDYLLER